MALFARTLRAFADTVVPPDEGPGGADVGALELYADPFYRAHLAVPGVALHLNARAMWRYRKTFASLPLAERTEVLRVCEASPLFGPAYEGLIMLTKLAFYGGVTSAAGHAYIGYPGPNDGYADEGHEKVVDGDTPDGNYP